MDQLPDFVKRQIQHFFRQYKELEPSKFVKIIGWENAEMAKKKIMEAVDLYQAKTKTLD